MSNYIRSMESTPDGAAAQSFTKSIVDEALYAVHYQRTKGMKVSCNPKMSIPQAHNLLREARDHGVISDKDYQVLMERPHE